jgi:Domain of unknown function (DUF5011)
MKKYFIIFSVCMIAIASCTKKTPEVVSKVVTVTYPGIKLKGKNIVFLPLNSTYVDSGAILTDDITGLKSDVKPNASNIDSSTPGWYEVNYQASNANGFLTNVSRLVLVLDYTPATAVTGNVDLEGLYARTANGIECNVIKLAKGLYASDNIAGSSLVYPGYFFMTDDSHIDVPAQTINFISGPVEMDYTDDALYQITDPYAFSYKVVNGSFGPAVRKFVKQ